MGSEMCIRDRRSGVAPTPPPTGPTAQPFRERTTGRSPAGGASGGGNGATGSRASAADEDEEMEVVDTEWTPAQRP